HTEVYRGNNLFEVDMDIYAPCALGATVNTQTIEMMNCEIIAGAANNQLADEVVHGQMVKDRGILYAPDFLINAGGLINVYREIAGYDQAEAMRRTENIYDTTLKIFNLSQEKNISSHEAALKIAEDRVAQKKAE